MDAGLEEHSEHHGRRTLDLVVNGTGRRLGAGTTVADVVTSLCPSPDGIAVACNGTVVPRSAWSSTPVADGDELEILTAAAGG
jgi:sulfur carrier protein